MDAYEKLCEKIEAEMEQFRKSYDTMTVTQIYNDWYIIGFYEAYSELLSSDYLKDQGVDDEIAWLAEKENPLRYLYDEWLDADGAMSYDWDDMLDFVCVCFREEQRREIPRLEDQIKSAQELVGATPNENDISQPVRD